jgi:hypothetical protein
LTINSANCIFVRFLRNVFINRMALLIVVFFMKRSEAIQILKKVLDECVFTDSYDMSLIPPSPDSPLAEGYQLVLKMPVTQIEKACMRKVIEKEGLVLDSSEDFVIIYESSTEKRT